MELCHDERGPHLVLPYERVEEARELLASLGIVFHEEDGSGAGCAGPVWLVLRLDAASLEAAGGAAVLATRR